MFSTIYQQRHREKTGNGPHVRLEEDGVHRVQAAQAAQAGEYYELTKKNKEDGQAVVVYTFNPSTREVEAGRSL